MLCIAPAVGQWSLRHRVHAIHFHNEYITERMGAPKTKDKEAFKSKFNPKDVNLLLERLAGSFVLDARAMLCPYYHEQWAFS